MKPLTPELKEQFNVLAARLSPENLSCDGELSRAETQRRYRRLMTEWHRLEKIVGRPVDEGELYR